MICVIWSQNSSSNSDNYCGVTMTASILSIILTISTIFKYNIDRILKWKTVIRVLFIITTIFRIVSFILIEIY